MKLRSQDPTTQIAKQPGVQSVGESGPKTPGQTIDLGTLALSQSGGVSPYLDANGRRTPLVPGFEGVFSEVRIIGLSPSGTRSENRYPIDDKGFVEPVVSRRALGHVPYEVRLVAKDGSEFRAVVDITPGKIKVMHSGYENLDGLKLERVPPPPPSSVTAGTLMLSQWGAVSGHLDAFGKTAPLIPGHEGRFSALRVIGLSPSGTRNENRFPIDDKGFVHGGVGRPLGHVPYELRLIDKDGAEYRAVVDITPGKTKVMHSGYDALTGIRFERVEPETKQPSADSESLGNFAQHGGVAGDPRQAPWTARLQK